MQRGKKQSGFAAFELIAVVVLLLLVALIGVKVYKGKSSVANETATTTTASQSQLSSDVQTAPTVNSSADLDKSIKALDDTNVDSSNNNDAAQLDKDSADL